MVLTKGKYALFTTERSIRTTIYDGVVPGPTDIMKQYMADTVMSISNLANYLEKLIPSAGVIYYDEADYISGKILTELRANRNTQLSDIAPLVSEMRVRKDETEIALIQKAIDITGEAFIEACKSCRTGLYEYDIEAVIEFVFRKNGSAMPAFSSIVGSGVNAVTLHYEKNSRRMEDGNLLLMDIGAEYGMYAADITRTIPVNGKFSDEQKDIYELVLKAQKAAIKELRPGNYYISAHNKSVSVMASGLYELGLLTDTASEWQKSFYTIYPISHYLGMSVHDVGDYGTDFEYMRTVIAKDTLYGRKLEEGMVLTIEPGLYLRDNGLSQLEELYGLKVSGEELGKFREAVSPAYEKYKNTGIRIEDDILVTAEGHSVLSSAIPKETSDIESLVRK
jgi:Xaa-Pro aminopeptidase